MTLLHPEMNPETFNTKSWKDSLIEGVIPSHDFEESTKVKRNRNSESTRTYTQNRPVYRLCENNSQISMSQ